MPLLLLIASAAAAPLSLADLPTRAGWDAYGQLLLDVNGTSLTAQDAAVVVLYAGADLPQSLTLTAEHLGGPSWRVPLTGDGDALSLAQELALLPEIASSFPDVVLPRQAAAVDFDDPVYPDQWYLETIGAQAFFERSLGSPQVRIAVIDSAIDIGHADLESAVMAPYDAFDDDNDPSPNPGDYCDGGDGICDDHGTAVSGIILARGNNATDMVGICPECTLIPIKMLGVGAGTLSRDIAAFEHAIAQDAAVINNSWGYTESIPVPEPLAMVIERAATETRGGLGAL
ncbi:MAG: subtilisin family serine protease, partial [Cognaticolwellia sp.]